MRQEDDTKKQVRSFILSWHKMTYFGPGKLGIKCCGRQYTLQWRHDELDGGSDQRKHQSSASLAFVRGIHRWPVNSPHKGPVTRNMFPFDVKCVLQLLVPAYHCTLSIPRYSIARCCTQHSNSDCKASVSLPNSQKTPYGWAMVAHVFRRLFGESNHDILGFRSLYSK